MTDMELMECRHSVRSYLDKPVEPEKRRAIEADVTAVNAESGLHVQVFFDEPECFGVNKADYGIFKNCKNYFVMTGPKGCEEKVGYYGQRLVLLAQSLGLNTCWAQMSYKKGGVKGETAPGEKRYLVIALGYGETQGHARKTKPEKKISNLTDDCPQWFKNGVKAAQLAPTAVNQQAFYLKREGDTVRAKTTLGLGHLTKLDLGIVKYQFELGAGKQNFTWSK